MLEIDRSGVTSQQKSCKPLMLVPVKILRRAPDIFGHMKLDFGPQASWRALNRIAILVLVSLDGIFLVENNIGSTALQEEVSVSHNFAKIQKERRRDFIKKTGREKDLNT